MPYVGGISNAERATVTEKPIKTSVYIEESKLEQLHKLSEHTRIKKAEYFREAIEDLLTKYRTVLQEISKKDTSKKRK